jgi:hypothetical protein
MRNKPLPEGQGPRYHQYDNLIKAFPKVALTLFLGVLVPFS